MLKSARAQSPEPQHARAPLAEANAAEPTGAFGGVNPQWLSLATSQRPGGDVPPIQPQLTVGAADDAFEREANVVAAQVLRRAQGNAGAPPRGPVARSPAPTAPLISALASVARLPSTSSAGVGDIAPESVASTVLAPGAGAPLPVAVRSRIEPVVGADLERVRVHGDASARRAARSIGARAFTHTRHIFLGPGETEHDLALLAHEAAHVVQQQAAPPARPRSDPSATPSRAPAGRLQRQPATQAPVLPGYSQAGDTCGATSLVSALMIWDSQRNDPAAPNDMVVNACNIVLTYLTQYRRATIQEWNERNLDGEELHTRFTDTLVAIRDHARLPGEHLTEGEYQAIGMALYFLYIDGQSGLSVAEISSLQRRLGLETDRSGNVQSFSDIFTNPVLAALRPGEIAQVGWYVMTSPPDESGRVSLGLHAFLMGRLNDGEWFLSDQGPSPAREIQALTLPDLEMAIRHAVRTDGYWLFTGAPSSFILGGWTGVKVLAGPGGVEQQAAGLVEAGRFLGEVDAGWTVDGNRLHAGAFVSRHYSLAEAASVDTAGFGGLIVEMPRGVFSFYRTELVSDDNLNVGGLDTGDSAGGLLLRRIFHHAWLRLCSENACRASLLSIY